MRQANGELTVATGGTGLVEITQDVTEWVAAQGMSAGLLTLFIRHTSASLLVNENAAAEVRGDIERYFARIAPEDATAYAHDDEGPDDMPAHLRTALTGVSLSIPVAGGRPVLGTWQGIFVFEHRRAPHRRRVAMHLIGE